MNSIIEITGIKISNIDYVTLIDLIEEALKNKGKLLVSYANTNTVNLTSRINGFKSLLNSHFLIHPDGVGIFVASKFLFPKNHFKFRFNGSDFYPLLAALAIKKKYSMFFFGHDDSTLQKIKSNYPDLEICGFNNGFDFETRSLTEHINKSKPDIMIIGLGQPVQEKWISENHAALETRVIMAVGDGIKVFAGEKKRGPAIMQNLGLEWLIRLFFNPFKYFHKYVVGNPVFLYRIFRAKLSKL